MREGFSSAMGGRGGNVQSVLGARARPTSGVLDKSVFIGDLKKGLAERVSLICSDLFWKQIGRNRSRLEKNQGTPENKERKSEENGEIGTKRGDPLLPTPEWGLRLHGFIIESPFWPNRTRTQ